MSYIKHGKNVNHPEFPHGKFAGYRAECRCKECIQANRDLKREYHKLHRHSGTPYAKRQAELKKAYRKTEKGRAVYRSANARRKQRIKKIYDAKLMNQIYENCPSGYQVDHIIPLSKGGLHRPDNVQYLLGEINNKKHASLNISIFSDYAIDWRDIVDGTFRDYPEREYAQASGSARLPTG